ncbi:MAG: hypothetical protein FWH55_02700 [Oscillospiraceae bacterium]|nr:hypothetical protein [Oscillospiraceae bacterium]
MSLIVNSLNQEVESVSAAIRREPLEPSHRLALAQLELVRGNHTKALRHLQLACQFNAEFAPEAQLIKMLVCAEQVRETVFAGKISPDLLNAPSAWLEKMIEAIRYTGEQAAEKRQSALLDMPKCKGYYGESSSFESIVDGDDRLGPIVELIFGGNYFWVPFDMIESLQIPIPTRPIDFVWIAVTVKLVGYPYRIAYMPSRYVLPENEDERTNSLLIGSETTWQEFYDDFWQGSGRKTWFADEKALSIFEAGQINIEH